MLGARLSLPIVIDINFIKFRAEGSSAGNLNNSIESGKAMGLCGTITRTNPRNCPRIFVVGNYVS